jgi:hypothetical protein
MLLPRSVINFFELDVDDDPSQFCVSPPADATHSHSIGLEMTTGLQISPILCSISRKRSPPLAAQVKKPVAMCEIGFLEIRSPKAR